MARVTLADVRRLALALPDVTEKPCYGTPGFYRKRVLIARLKEDGVTLVLRVERDVRDAMLDNEPTIFSLTPHYESGPWVLVNLATVGKRRLSDLLEAA